MHAYIQDLRFNANPVIDGILEFLLAPKVALGRLDVYVSEEELDLVEFATRNMAEAGTRATQVVGRHLFETCLFSEGLYDIPDHLFSQASSPNEPALVDGPEDAACHNFRRPAPVVDPVFDPLRNRYGADGASFAHEIHDGPVILALLNVIHGEVHKFRPPQPAPEKHAKYGSVPLAAQSFRFRCVNQPASLFRCQPVAEPHAKLLHTFDPADTRREFRAQQSCVRSLVGQTSHGG